MNFSESKGVDPGAVIKLLINNWYIFFITISLAFLGAKIYIDHTMPVYEVSTSILINEGGDRNLTDHDELMQGLGLPGGMSGIDNQLNILESRALTKRVIEELDLEIEYYFKTTKNSIPLYPSSPAKIVLLGKKSLPKNVEFSMTYLGNNNFNLKSEVLGYDFLGTFGDAIKMEDVTLVIEAIDVNWFESNKEVEFCFISYSLESLIRYFNSRLEVEPLSTSGSILQISLSGINKARDVDFLNKLASVFKKLSLEKKNLEADRRIQFINSQLVGISDSLVITENQLQQFRSSHRVMDLSAQGQVIITQVTNLENEKARLTLEANYYESLAEYLKRNKEGELPLPISLGIEDETLTLLVTELADMQEQLSSTGGGEKNPLQNLLNQRIKSKKEELVETLNGLIRANSLAQKENQSQILRVNSQASALPVTERQLLGIERKFKINDELYTFLLEKRSELQMQRASNVPDNEVIDPASVEYATIVAPDQNMIYFLALFMGAFVPFIVLLLLFILNKTVREDDIQDYVSIPIVGNIPQERNNKLLEVINYPESELAESYRMIRSKLQFITQDKINPIILITSSMPADGKSVTSVNLATVYSLLGKKTVLVSCDLRQPKFNGIISNEDRGISTYLIGKDKIEDIVQKTKYENFFVIPPGPIPPNPSELIASEKTRELFEILKSNFDCIIVDTAPLGMVSDSHHLITYADATLMVVRIKHTLKNMLADILNELNQDRRKHIALIINGTTKEKKKYGYGKKYGYTSRNKV